MKKNWWKWALGAFALLVVIGAILPEPEESRTEDKPPPRVAMKLETVPFSVTGRKTVVDGTVKPARAAVELDGEPVEVATDGTFSLALIHGRHGDFDYAVSATMRGHRTDSESLNVTRKLTEAEIAAKRERARQRRIAAAEERERQRQADIARKAQERDDFIASATTIDYDQLAKNPDDYKGTEVAYTGQIFQIQEDYGATWMLLSVTDMGYDIWDDNIWVEYPGEIQGAEEDIVTIYGVVKGEESYETQIGGETYVPKVAAKYVTE